MRIEKFEFEKFKNIILSNPKTKKLHLFTYIRFYFMVVKNVLEIMMGLMVY